MSEVPVKVFVRVRPLLPSEAVSSAGVCVKFVSADQLVLGRDKAFRFDHVFPPEAGQELLFDCCVQPLIGPCLDGYNATVFAYGQTGSGKSYTMGSEGCRGGEWRGEEVGLIPRALEEILRRVQASAGVEFSLRISYMEVYKEELRDLLDGGMSAREIHIREDEWGNTVITGATEEVVTSAEEGMYWLSVGNTARITGATQMNQRSSRSHAIFTIFIEHCSVLPPSSAEAGVEEEEGEEKKYTSAKFHFVDLAGSERAGRTGNAGERFKESVHINCGLLALGNVISALGEPRRKSSHIPYRDSKITRILKDSLGGNAQTVMITCLSPSDENFTENMNALKYAKRARNIKNRPVVNCDPQVTRLQEMRKEIDALREELWQTQQAVSESKSTTVGTVGLSAATEQHLTDPSSPLIRDLEAQIGRLRERCTSYRILLKGAQEKMQDLREVVGVSPSLHQQLECWLIDLNAAIRDEVPEGGEDASSMLPKVVESKGTLSQIDRLSPVSASALHRTIERLQSELEQCRLDLQTDEELFSEKVDELGAMWGSYERLLQERDRVETLWAAARETEAKLRQTIADLAQTVSSLELELVAKETTIQQLHEEVYSRQTLRSGTSVIRDHYDDEHRGKEVLSHAMELQITGSGVTGGPDDLDREHSRCTYISEDTPEEEAEEQAEEEAEEEEEEEEEKEKNDDSLFFVDFSRNCLLLRGKVETHRPEDFSEDALLASLHALTDTLVQSQQCASPAPSPQPHPIIQAPPHTSQPPPFGQTRTIAVPSSARHRTVTPPEDPHGGKCLSAVPLERGRDSATPDEALWHQTSSLAPLPTFPRLNASYHDCGMSGGGSQEAGGGHVTEMEVLNRSALKSRQMLSATDNELSQANEELRNLNIKIRLKEELIRELVQNSKTNQRLNKVYFSKVQKLEQEATAVQGELLRSQRLVQRHQGEARLTSDMQTAAEEQRKKLAATESKLSVLQRKQKETQRLVQYGLRSERRIGDLEGEIERLRNHQEELRRTLQREGKKKSQLEGELQRHQHQVQSLKVRSEQQRRVLRIKTEEAASAKRKLRQLSRPFSHTTPSAASQLEAKKSLLDAELEKMLHQKQSIEAMEKDLSEREQILAEREALVAERDALESQRLRSSQEAALDITRLSMQIDSIESSIKLKEPSPSEQERVGRLKKERNDLIARRTQIQQGMEEGSLTMTVDQRRLQEICEHIELLDAAIDYKNQSIAARNVNVNWIVHGEELSQTVRQKITHLSPAENQAVLAHYFGKVVQLRLSERQQGEAARRLEAELSEQSEVVRRLERALKQAQAEAERRVLLLQKDNEKRVQLLMQQLTEADSASMTSQESEAVQTLQEKVKLLEKDLYYYKKTSRDLKKKLLVLKSEGSQESGDSELACSQDTDKPTTGGGMGVASGGAEGHHPVTGSSSVTSNGTVVKKSRRQLRQLSASDIAERRAKSSKSHDPT